MIGLALERKLIQKLCIAANRRFEKPAIKGEQQWKFNFGLC